MWWGRFKQHFKSSRANPPYVPHPSITYLPKIEPEEQPMSISFVHLPPEVLQIIAAYLPAPSAAALALCNRSISSALGTQYWKALGSWREGGGGKYQRSFDLREAMSIEPQQDARSEFLSLLERDLPAYIFCRRCAWLHLPTFERDSNAESERLCAKVDSRTISIAAISRQTRFSLLQWTMKRHRMGLDCDEQLRYFSADEPCCWIYKEYFLRETRIVEGKALVRSQNWYLIPVEDVTSHSLAMIYLCYHLWHKKKESLLTKMIDCKLSHWNSKAACSFCDGLHQCRYCNTEFQLDVKNFGASSVALVLTAWLDLGQCITPLDSKWAYRFCLPKYNRHTRKNERIMFEPGSIRDLFEDEKAFVFDSILNPDREEAFLRGKCKTYSNSSHFTCETQ